VEFFGELCTKYRLRKKTLFLATHYYDQYSQRKSMTVLSSEKQAVVAQACLFIAMKFEEIYPPQLKTWCSSIEEVVKAEALILKDLNFRLSYTSAQHYLELYLSKHPVENSQKQLYQCILELFLVTGRIYEDHPLRIVQNVLDSFRPTLFLESHLVEVDRSIKQLIL
jgi:G2/mitotic-specific cyclin 2